MNSLPNYQSKAVLEGIDTLCRIFWGPDTQLCEEMVKDDLFKPLGALAAPSLAGTLDQIRSFLSPYTDPASLCRDLEPAYIRLFISSREGVTAPLYQSCYEYENAPLMGPPALEMEKRFQSKGLSLAKHLHEPPDHISVELEYLYFLLDRKWAEEDGILLAEAVSFADAMLSWINQLREKLAGEKRCLFYPLAVSLLVSILDFIASEKQTDCRT